MELNCLQNILQRNFYYEIEKILIFHEIYEIFNLFIINTKEKRFSVFSIINFHVFMKNLKLEKCIECT